MPSMRILVVDDHPYVLAGFLTTLRCPGAVDVALALGADDALKQLAHAHGSFDAIVSDIHMPGIDGEALLHEVARTFPHIRRIALTGDATSAKAEGARRVCDAFLEKPCSPGELIRVVRETLAARQEESALPLRSASR